MKLCFWFLILFSFIYLEVNEAHNLLDTPHFHFSSMRIKNPSFFSYPSFDVLRMIDRGTYSQWSVIATEKVHGSNFCITIFPSSSSSVANSPPIIRCAKRTGWLYEDQTFFCFQEVLQKHQEKVLKVFSSLQTIHSDLFGVFIYGKLYGFLPTS
jgi:hypothetical protein